MKRSALALGASVLALALTAGPAAAEPGAGQTVDDTTGAAQVGAVAVDAPVRVASDGDSTTAGASAGGPQTTGDSTGGGPGHVRRRQRARAGVERRRRLAEAGGGSAGDPSRRATRRARPRSAHRDGVDSSRR